MITDETIDMIVNRKRSSKETTHVLKSNYEDKEGDIKPFQVSVLGEGIDDCRLQFVPTKNFLELLERLTACTFMDSTASTGTTTIKFEDNTEYVIKSLVTSTNDIIHVKTYTKDLVILRATGDYHSRLMMEQQNELS